MNFKMVQGEVEPYSEVNILHNSTRIGHADRERTIKHIADVEARGYIKPDEAEKRIRLAENAEKASEIKALTSDLPAPFHKAGFIESYDWDDTTYWVPTLVTGIALSAALTVVPSLVLSAEHMFPHTGFGLGVGIVTIIFGIIGFFSCIAGVIVKSD